MTMDYDRNDYEGLYNLLKLGADTDFNKRSLKEQKAARKAQDSYNKKRLELERKGLGLQADQLAKQYAMQQAQLEWDKESFRMEFGETQRNNEWERGFRDREMALENEWRTAEQTGFRGGVPTLQKLQMDEDQRQFNVQAGLSRDELAERQRQFNVGSGQWDREFGEGQRRFDTETGQWQQQFGEDTRRYEQDFGESSRRYEQDFGEDRRRYDQGFGEDRRRYDQDFGEGQRQFNVGTVMNAPRGPADWAAYTKKLRALQGSGAMPGAVGAMFDPSQQVASFSSGGQQTGPVLSNADLALSMVGQGDQAALQGTPWEGMGATNEQMYRARNPNAPAAEGFVPPNVRRKTVATASGGFAHDGGSTELGLASAPQGTMSALPYGNTGINPNAPVSAENFAARGAKTPGQTSPPVRNFAHDGGSTMHVATGSANPYSESGQPRGGGGQVAQMLGAPQPSTANLPSAQKFRRFAPTEQAMGLGYLAEEGGPTEDDAQYLMSRQAPQFQRGRKAAYAGM